MRNQEAVQFVFEGAIRSDRFVAFSRHRPSRLDLHLALGPCPDERLLSGPRYDDAQDGTPQDCVVYDVDRIGGDRG